MIKTITIKAYGRPEILRLTIQSLLLDTGSKDWFYCISADYSDDIDTVVSTIQEELDGKVDYTIITSDTRLGIARNHYKAVAYAFEELGSDWNLDFDDDYIVYTGWNNLCTYYIDVLFKVYHTMFSGHLQSLYPFGNIDNFYLPEELIWLSRHYSHHGTLLPRYKWQDGYNTYLKNYVDRGGLSCEGATIGWIKENGLRTARPVVSRIEYQPNNGVNWNIESCVQANASMVYTDKHIDRFRLLGMFE